MTEACRSRRLDHCTMAELVAIYNLASENTVRRFMDHQTAIRRTADALERASMQYIPGPSGTVAVAPLGGSPDMGDHMLLVRILVRKCPKRPGTSAHARWQVLEDGITVGRYVARCREIGWTQVEAIRDIRWNLDHGYIALEMPPGVVMPET